MTIDANIVVLQAALESTYGTDPGSGYVAIAGEKGAVSIKPSAQAIERNRLKSHGSPDKKKKTARVFDISITVELKGAGMSGGAVVAPEWDLLARASGLEKRDGIRLAYDGLAGGSVAVGNTFINTTSGDATVGDAYETITNELFILQPTSSPNVPADNDALSTQSGAVTLAANGAPKDMIVYKPLTSNAHESLTFRFNYNGVRFLSTGARGTWSTSWSTAGYPMLSFTFQGLYAEPTDVPTPTGLSYVLTDPEAVEDVILRLAAVDLTDIMINNFSYDSGASLRQRPGMAPATGIKEIKQSQQRTSSGSIDPEMALMAAHNPFSTWNASTLQVLSLQLGSTTGERIRMTLPGIDIDDIDITDDEDRKTPLNYTAVGEQVSTAGDDEVFLAAMEV